MSGAPMGISGRIAALFQSSELTPLLALTGLLLGLFAVMITPKEEEPQIDVTFANVFIPFPGADVGEVESLVATPAEQVMSELAGVEHVYSLSRPGMAVLTVQFEVGRAAPRCHCRSVQSGVFQSRLAARQSRCTTTAGTADGH